MPIFYRKNPCHTLSSRVMPCRGEKRPFRRNKKGRKFPESLPAPKKIKKSESLFTITRFHGIIIIQEDNGENFEKEDTDMPRPGGGGFGGGPRGGGPGRPGGDFEGPWMGWRPRPPYERPPFGGRPPRRPYYGGCFPWGCGCCLPIIGVVALAILGAVLLAFLL